MEARTRVIWERDCLKYVYGSHFGLSKCRSLHFRLVVHDMKFFFGRFLIDPVPCESSQA